MLQQFKGEAPKSQTRGLPVIRLAAGLRCEEDL